MLLAGSFGVSFFALFFLSTYLITQGLSPTTWVFAIGCPILLLNPFLLRLTRSPDIPSILFALELTGFLGYVAYQNGGPAAPALLWTAVVPLVAGILVGRRFALICALLVTAQLLVFFELGQAGYPFPRPLTEAWLLWFQVAGLVTLTLFLTWIGTLARELLEQQVLKGRHAFQDANEQLQLELSRRREAERETDQRLSEQTTLLRASRAFAESLEYDSVLPKILEQALLLTQANDAHIFLYDDNHIKFGVALWQGEMLVKPLGEPRQDGLTYRVARSGQRIVVSDVNNHELYKDWGWSGPDGAIIGLPLRSGERIIGVMNIAFMVKHDFSENELRLVEGLAQQAALAVERSRLYEKIKRENAERKRVQDELRQSQEHLEELVEGRTSELRAANQEMEAFTYSVSHDLRAPLRHVNGYVEMLRNREEGRLDEESARFLANILASVKHMGELIDGLLSISRVTRVELKVQAIELSTLAAEIRDELEQENPDRRISWSIEAVPVVLGDPALIRIVMTNLLANAVKFTGKTDEASIKFAAVQTLSPQSVVTLEVSDNGVGFDQDYVNKLFGVFQRLHAVDEFAGTGIGLATVQRIIDRHGEKIWAEGKVNEGASFYFTLSAG